MTVLSLKRSVYILWNQRPTALFSRAFHGSCSEPVESQRYQVQVLAIRRKLIGMFDSQCEEHRWVIDVRQHRLYLTELHE